MRTGGVDQVDLQLTQLRFAEAEQMLAQLRTVVPADNTKAFGLIDVLLAGVRAQVAEATAKQDAAYSAVEADFVKKFTWGLSSLSVAASVLPPRWAT